jgi:hypothetical protein
MRRQRACGADGLEAESMRLCGGREHAVYVLRGAVIGEVRMGWRQRACAYEGTDVVVRGHIYSSTLVVRGHIYSSTLLLFSGTRTGSIRQHTSAYVADTYIAVLCYSSLCTRAGSICQHTPRSIRQHPSASVSIRQHTSAYVSICQHTSA